MDKHFWQTPLIAMSVAFLALGASHGSYAKRAQPGWEAAKEEALASETAGKWKQIHWQPDIQSAIILSKQTSKPILVVLVVGHMAKKGSAEP